MTKPVMGAGGEILGAVRVHVKPTALVSTYSPISAMAGRSYALFTRDGRVLARYPNRVSLSAGQVLPRTSPFYATLAAGGGAYETISAFDGQARLIALVAHGHQSRLFIGSTLGPKVFRVAFLRKTDDAVRGGEDGLR